MSTSKTLSKGTLSLRFMQNAQRTKQQASVDLDRAKVKDDAEWEIAKEIREAWGLTTESNTEEEQTIAYEPSYLPFLFPSLQGTGPSSDGSAAISSASSKLPGRRKFAKGSEVPSTPPADGPGGASVKQESDAAAESSTRSSSEKPNDRFNLGTGPLTKKRAHRLAELDRAGVLPTGESSKSDVPVLSMISEETSAAVGMDIRQLRKLKAKATVPTATQDDTKPSAANRDKAKNSVGKGPLSFLRPAGVDSPTLPSKSGNKDRKRRRDMEAGEFASPETVRKVDSEAVAIADTSESQTAKKKKKLKKAGSGLSTAPP